MCRSKIYGVLSPTAASRSSDGFDMLASLLPSPLRSPPAPAPYATAGSSVNRLGGPQVLMSDIGPSGTSYDGRQTLATSLQEARQTHIKRLGGPMLQILAKQRGVQEIMLAVCL